MLNYFNQHEKYLLQDLKTNLISCPGEFFFKPINGRREFIKISYSMWEQSLHFFGRGLGCVMPALKASKEICYSLISLNWSEASQQFVTAVNKIIESITKLILSAALFALFVARFLTLLTRTFVHELNGYDGQKKLLYNVDTFETHDERELNKSLSVIGVERRTIDQTINNLFVLIASENEKSNSSENEKSNSSENEKFNSSCPSFFANSNIPRRVLADESRFKVLLEEYNKLIDSYPAYEDFDKGPGCYVIMRQALTEHHILAMEIANELLKALYELRARQQRLCEFQSPNNELKTTEFSYEARKK